MVILKFGKGQSVRLDDAKPAVDEVNAVAEFFNLTPEATPATESESAIAEAVAERGEQYDAEAGIDNAVAVELVDDVGSEVGGEVAEEPTDIEADEQGAATGKESTTPQPIPDLQPSYQEQLDDARDEFTEISLEAAECEKNLKMLKADMKAALKRLKNLIDKGPTAATIVYKLPEFTADESSIDGSDSTTSQPQPPKSDAWRFTPLPELDLPESLTAKIIECGYETLGELEDLRSAISTGKAEWPKGIGVAKITQIEDAVVGWWAKSAASVEVASVAGGEVVEASDAAEIKE
jgi:hypothetical protein